MYADDMEEMEMSEQGRLSQSLLGTSFKDQPSDDEEGSDTSSTSSSSSSTVGRKGSNPEAEISRMQHQDQYERDDLSDDDDGVGESRGLLSNMDHSERRQEHVAGLSRTQVTKKRHNRRKIIAGVAGGVAGLVMVGPCTAVAAGVAGVMLIRRRDKKKQKEALTLTNNAEAELASLISPKAQV